MIDRFDHVVIGVRDLQTAADQYRVLGFDVRPGGRHLGRGTENALIRFGLDYIELIAVYDEAEAEAAGRGTLVEFVRQHEGGLVSYALATTDVEADAARFVNEGLEARGPYPVERERPDGSRVTWRLLVPGGDQYRRPWPFFIQWDDLDDERLAREAPGRHPNGARAVREVAIVVADLQSALDLYSRQLGLSPAERGAAPDLAAERAVFGLGDLQIVLLAPTGSGPAREALDAMGEGPFHVVLAGDDLELARRWLRERGAAVSSAPGVSGGLLIDPARALGARLIVA